jgi:tetraacyldisaccharide-1-P 4'-kinase
MACSITGWRAMSNWPSSMAVASGNGCLLPAGPLREGAGAAGQVDAVICNGLPR